MDANPVVPKNEDESVSFNVTKIVEGLTQARGSNTYLWVWFYGNKLLGVIDNKEGSTGRIGPIDLSWANNSPMVDPTLDYLIELYAHLHLKHQDLDLSTYPYVLFLNTNLRRIVFNNDSFDNVTSVEFIYHGEIPSQVFPLEYSGKYEDPG